MVDISKCGGNDCPVKLECWRYTAPSGHWQAWGDFDKIKQGRKRSPHNEGRTDAII